MIPAADHPFRSTWSERMLSDGAPTERTYYSKEERIKRLREGAARRVAMCRASAKRVDRAMRGFEAGRLAWIEVEEAKVQHRINEERAEYALELLNLEETS